LDNPQPARRLDPTVMPPDYTTIAMIILAVAGIGVLLGQIATLPKRKP